MDPVAQARNLISGHAKTRIVLAASDTGVLEALAPGPLELATLASKTGLDPDPLERLLIGAASLGLVRHMDGQWALTDVGEACLRPGIVGMINRTKNRTLPLFERLTDAVRENRPVMEEVFGVSSLDEIYRDMPEEDRVHFFQGLHSTLVPAVRAALAHLDLSGCRVLLDVGGGTGGFSIEAVKAYPGLRAIVFDLERTIELGNPFAEGEGVADRVEYRAGDLFAEELPEADVAVLSLMLRWMSPVQQQTALRRCYDALCPGGLLCVMEMLVNDDLSGPLMPAIMCLGAFLQGEGRDRTAAQWTEILHEAEFVDVDAHRLGDDITRDLLVARKPR